MLDLNLPTANTITATLSPHDAEILKHSQHHMAAEMASAHYSSASSSVSSNLTEIKGNVTQQLSSYAKTATSSPFSDGALYPMVNVASNFIFDWCNQSLSNPDISSNNIPNSNSNPALSGYNCSQLTSTNNWNTSTNDTYIDISFILPWWRQVLWSILFGGMVIVATGGNLIVVWIVMTTKRMRTVTNYFIVNLSIADAMVSSLNVTFNYIYMLDNDWPFGELYCKISQFIATLSISASVFTLMAISIDRYVAIMKPLKPRMSKRSNLAIAAAIWLTSAVISCPMLLFFTTDSISSKDGIRTVCFSEWPDGSTNHSTQEYIYNILFMILTYFMPIISMTVTYSLVGLELWGSKAIGEYTPRQVENVKSKRRVVKMMMVVVLIFAVCWLPFHAYFIVTACYPELTEATFIQELYLFIYWLAMSNSMYNPIIYCWMNSRFRFGFKMFFRWCPYVHVGTENLNRRDNMTSRYSCSGSPDHNRIKRNDTQRSFLYTCPGSPKSRRISHCGVVRSSTILTSHRDSSRHSTPLTATTVCSSGGNYLQQHHHLHHHHPNALSSYHQHCSLKMGSNNDKNSHELTSLTAGSVSITGAGCNGPPQLQLYPNSKDLVLKTTTRASGGKWSTNTKTTPSPTTENGIEVSCSSTFNGVNDKNYLANRAALMS